MEFSWDIINQTKEIEYLQKCLISGRLHHGYLFCGPKDVGKKRIVQCFIYSLFCHSKTHRRPCGHCQACEQISKNIHPDIFWLKEERSIKIEAVREVISKLQKKSLYESFKVAVIEDAEKVTLEASNALLKTLEEPPPKTIIILICQTTTHLPLTILSRVVSLNFNLVPKKEIYYWLQTKTDLETAKLISFQAQGKPELARRLLTNRKYLQNQEKTNQEILSLIGENTSRRLEKVDALAKGISWDNWIQFFRDLLLLRFNLESYLTNFPNRDKLKDVARRYSVLELIKIINDCGRYKKLAEKSINQKLLLTNLIINI